MSDLPDPHKTIEGLTEVTRHGSTFSVGGSGQSFYDLTLLRNALTLIKNQQERIAELEAQVAKMSLRVEVAELRIPDLRAKRGS